MNTILKKLMVILFIFLIISITGCTMKAKRYIEPVSVSSNGELGNAFSISPAINWDGNLVAFTSRATNLVSGYNLSPHFHQVYVRDLLNKTTEIVSISTTGIPADDDAMEPSISKDGRYVAFYSASDKLDPNAVGRVYANGQMIYLRDRLEGTTRVISLPNNLFDVHSVEPKMVPKGQGVYYYNYRQKQSYSDTNFWGRLYFYNIYHNRTTQVGDNYYPFEVDEVDGRGLSTSHDSMKIAFQSTKSFNVTNRDGSDFPVKIVDQLSKIYLFDFFDDKIYLVSNPYWNCDASCDFRQYWHNANKDSYRPSINPGGNQVAFETDATNILNYGFDSNKMSDIYVFDLNKWLANEPLAYYIWPVSVSSEGVISNGKSKSPSMTNGYVAFGSNATNLDVNDDNGKDDVFRHNIDTKETIRISTGIEYGTDSSGSGDPSISYNGEDIAFTVDFSHTFNGQYSPHHQIYVSRKIFVVSWS